MIHPQTLTFLRKLSTNNTREWFNANRAQYDAAKSNMIALVQDVINSFGKSDPSIATLEAKDCVFRINRDIRFSKDKSPYKRNLAASINPGGKKSQFGGYYIHIEPGNKSFIGGGIYQPDAPLVKKIRQEIDYNWEEFSGLLKNKAFKTWYGDLDRSPELSLTREPKDYEKDNPAIDYIKLKSWIAFHELSDEALQDKGLAKKIVRAFEALQPAIMFLNRAIAD